MCPQMINFQIPFAAIGSRGMGVELLPPSYVCDLGQGGRISCSYAMHINVSQKSRHAFWTNRNRYVHLSSHFFHPSLPIFPLCPHSRFKFSVWSFGVGLYFYSSDLIYEFTFGTVLNLVREDSHVIPINYVPRCRPPHAFPRDIVLPLSIKAFPENWRQIITTQGRINCNVRLVLFTLLHFSSTV